MASDTRTIECEDCGREYETIRSNTKWCRVCSLLRTVKYFYGHTRECVACAREFSPLGSNRDDPFCGNCARPSWHDVTGTCAFCNTTQDLIHDDVRVCKSCARDPEQRDLFIKALYRKQQEA